MIVLRLPAILSAGLICLAVLLAGCDLDKSKREQEETSRRLAPVPGVLLHPSLVLTGASLALLDTTLSPAILLRSDQRRVTLFAPTPAHPGTSPRHVAYGSGGPKVLTNGVPTVATNLMEGWVIAWFGGSQAAREGDVPLCVFLERSASRVSLDSNGLHLTFSSEAGHIGIMALYGARLVPGQPSELAGLSRGELKKTPKPWEWLPFVPREPLTRARFWASALAKVPYQAWQLPEPEPDRPGHVRVHVRFAWLSVSSGWEVPRQPLAPIKGEWGELWKSNPAQIEFVPRCFDMDWKTLHGDLVTLTGSEAYSVVLPSAVATADVVSAGWKEHVMSSANPLTLDPGTRMLEWRGLKAGGEVRRPLGQVKLEDVDIGVASTRTINANTRIITWTTRRPDATQ